MRKNVICVAWLLALATVVSADDSILIKRTAVSPVIDGKLDDPCWQAAAALKLRPYQAGGTLRNPTEVFLSYDADNLYAAFCCHEEQMDKLRTVWAAPEARDGNLCADDCVEVLLNPLAGGLQLYHFIVNAAGIVYDSRNEAITWDSQTRVAVCREKSYWAVELAIPFTDLGCAPQGGEVWSGNLCREEQPAQELSSLSSAGGGFANQQAFAHFLFEGGSGDYPIQIESLAVKGEDKLRFRLGNKTGASQSFTVRVLNRSRGMSMFSASDKLQLAPSESKTKEMAYQTAPGEQQLELSIATAEPRVEFYRNTFMIMKETAAAKDEDLVWNISDPLFAELLSKDPPGLARDGCITWNTTGRGRSGMMRPFALQYGFRFVSEESYQVAKRDGFISEGFHSRIKAKDEVIAINRKYGLKLIIYSSASLRASMPKEYKGASLPNDPSMVFLPDPVCAQAYLERIRNLLNAFPPELIWGLFFGDEVYDLTLKLGVLCFAEAKNDYAFIRQADAEVREKYGAGKYGIPESLTDPNQFRWIAYNRWMAEKFSNLFIQVRATVKSVCPQAVVISDDPTGSTHPFNYGSWRKGCDVIQHQLSGGPNSSGRQGFMVKLIKDISGITEFFPCTHGENYASTLTAEQTLWYLSEVIRNGATGLIFFPSDVRGAESGKCFLQYEYYGAPERWQVDAAVANRLKTLPPLLRTKPEFAVLYSCDTQSAAPGCGVTDAPLYSAYMIFGPVLRTAFQFIDDNQIERNDVDLRSFKAVFVPAARIERIGVVRRLKEYVEQGGVLVAGDPAVFSLNVDGDVLDAEREALLGAKIVQKQVSKKGNIKHGEAFLPCYSKLYDVLPSPGSEVIAAFENGEPAIIGKASGKGKTYYFASNPFTAQISTSPEWRKYFTSLLGSLNITMNQPIWRFQFPASLIQPPPLPEGKCLTGNHIVWRQCKPLDLCNLKTEGTYTYSLPPDKVADEGNGKDIPFSSGKLTNRRKAPTAGNVDCGKSQLSDWIVTYEKTDSFSVTFDFKRDYAVAGIRIFYSGQLPGVGIACSSDGTNWSKVVETEAERTTEDVPDRSFTFAPVTCRYLKIDFGPRENKNSMTLAELEIWGEKGK